MIYVNLLTQAKKKNFLYCMQLEPQYLDVISLLLEELFYACIN